MLNRQTAKTVMATSFVLVMLLVRFNDPTRYEKYILIQVKLHIAY